jgi:predicted nucleotidyltransferase
MKAVQDYRRTIDELKKSVSELGLPIDSLILYGSAARGEYKGIDSDIDILVISEDKTNSTYEKILRIASDIDLKNSTATSLVYFSREEFERIAPISPFLETVAQEGITLYDNGTFERFRAGLVKVSR